MEGNKKKIIGVLAVLALVLILAVFGRGGNKETTPAASTTAPASTAGAPAFEGKIAVVTNTVSQNEEEFRSAEQLMAKYGPEKIIHRTWPDNFMNEQEQMITTVQGLAADPEIKILILNQAVPGCNPAIDKVLETRKDMFVVYCTPQENPPDVAQRANLTVIPNELAMGPAMVQQAVSMGAKTFVHYSFPRHMSQPLLSGRRELMKEECKKLNIQFVDATAPDPTSDVGLPGAQQFILEDVPKMVAAYGKDTAFFSTNCAMQVPLITKVVDTQAIYPQPCCPSPYHGFPAALGIETGETVSIEYVIEETTKALEAKGVLGRLSTWPVPAAMMMTGASAEYGILWLNGDVPKEGIDLDALSKCMADYIIEKTGNTLDVQLSTYNEGGQAFDNFVFCFMDYLTY